MTIKVPKDMDFHAQAKRDGTWHTNACKTSTVYPTDGKPMPPDGKTSGPMKQPQRFAPLNPAAKPNAREHPVKNRIYDTLNPSKNTPSKPT